MATLYTFDATGLTIKTEDEIIDELIDDYKSIHGDGIKTDEQSVIGSELRNFADSFSQLLELAEHVYNSFDPQAATGTATSRLALFNGLERQAQVYSTATVTCGVSAATTIPAGSIIEDEDTGVEWTTDSNLVFAAAGEDDVAVTCSLPGAYTAAADKLTVIQTPVYAWNGDPGGTGLAVKNDDPATAGRAQETDAALRLRRQTVSERASTTSASAIYGAITDVDNVEAVKVVVNDGTATDSDGVEPQHVWCVVDGGTDADVAEAIFEHVGAGIGMAGSTTVSHTDAVSGDDYDVSWTKATDLTIYVTVNLTTDDDYPTDGDEQVEDAIIAHLAALDIGDDVIYSRLYTPVNSIAGHQVDSLYVDITSTPTATSNIAVNLPSKAVATAVSVVVNS